MSGIDAAASGIKFRPECAAGRRPLPCRGVQGDRGGLGNSNGSFIPAAIALPSTQSYTSPPCMHRLTSPSPPNCEVHTLRDNEVLPKVELIRPALLSAPATSSLLPLGKYQQE
eukprot:TRINITY_DN3580_c0_g1_i1.p1 TRINITY_DN3580_c0_g1~~TRINITY_DN3580_c0_g1_i1.p1  ORF type:complete len:113 (-),score=13.64 TRINITY_DN3580_c0_g1_i1:19-357(-)